MNEGPFTTNINKSDLKGVIRREIITYRWRDNILVKESAVRTYNNKNDYTDSVTSIPLPQPES
jgi:hypothetical protein